MKKNIIEVDTIKIDGRNTEGFTCSPNSTGFSPCNIWFRLTAFAILAGFFIYGQIQDNPPRDKADEDAYIETILPNSVV